MSDLAGYYLKLELSRTGQSEDGSRIIGHNVQTQAEFIFLMEVKVLREKLEHVREKINFQGLCFVPGINNGGGLAFLWRNRDTVNLNSYSANFIDVKILLPYSNQWWLTGYYSFPERRQHPGIYYGIYLTNRPFLGAVWAILMTCWLNHKKEVDYFIRSILLTGFIKQLKTVGLSILG